MYVTSYLLYVLLFHKNNSLVSQIQNETPELANGAAKAVFAVYDAVTHDLLSSDLRCLFIYFGRGGLSLTVALLLYLKHNNSQFSFD